MEDILNISKNYYNKSFRVPEDIVAKNSRYPLLEQVMLVSVGHRDGKHNIGHYVRRYSKEEYCIIYCTCGEGWVEYENKKRIIRPGEILFCFHDTIHCYGSDKNNPWTIYWSCFKGDHVRYLLELINITAENSVLQIGNSTKIMVLFFEILNILERGYAENHLTYVSNCLKLMLNYLSILQIYIEDKPYSVPVITNSITIMMEKINEIVTLEEFASKANMSPDYFIKFFREHTGYTPIDYHIRMKMQKASTLLNTTGLTVKEIASQLGYEDAYYFSRIFKKKTGYSPSRYRLMVKT